MGELNRFNLCLIISDFNHNKPTALSLRLKFVYRMERYEVMKTIIILGDGVKQICFTPETENEKKALRMITTEDDIHTVIKRGTLYDRDEEILGVDVYKCQGGYLRARDDTDSVLFVLTPKKDKESNNEM